MLAQNKTTKKIISSIMALTVLMLATFFFSLPQKAHAQLTVFDVTTEVNTGTIAGSSGTTTGLVGKDWAQTLEKNVIAAFEKTLIQKMVQSVDNWINSGFSGSPLYLQNAQSTFTDIAKTQIKNLVDTYGYDPVKYPFGQDFALNLINSYKTQAADNTAYTLSSVISDPTTLENFRDNFSVGGWNGFLINTQYPQNNYIGAQMIMDNQAAQQLAGTNQNVAQQTKTALQQGSGFLSPKVCATNSNYNNLNNEFSPPTFKTTVPYTWEPDPGESDEFNAAQEATYDTSYNAKVAVDQANWSIKNACPPRSDGSSGLVVTTPGDVVANQITTAMGSTFRSSELDVALGNGLTAIVSTLLNHFLDQGLNALSNVTNPAAAPDTWNYEGQALGTSASPYNTAVGTTTTTTTNTPLTTSTQSVSVSDSIVTNVTISGGTPPYSMQTQPDTGMAVGFMYDENTLTIAGTGVTPGNTSIVIQDSSSPVQTATVQITATGGITTEPPILTTMPPSSPPPPPSQSTLTCTPNGDGSFSCSQSNTSVSTSGSCPVGPGTGTPPPNATDPDAVLAGATITGGSPTDVARWPVTTTITAVHTDPAISIDFPAKDTWPDQVTSTDGVGTTQYTIWLFLNINGQWIGSGFIDMWKGRPDAGGGTTSDYLQLPNNWYYYADGMKGHQLQPGEQVGFMVTAGNERQGTQTSVKERSNLVLVNLPVPDNGGACADGSSGGSPTTGGTTTNPTNTPTTLAITSLNLSSAKAGDNLIITGTQLTENVLFYDSSNARSAVAGTINSTGTQVTVTVPDLTTGNYTVKVAGTAGVSNNSVSNGEPLTISGTTVAAAPIQVYPSIPPIASLNLGAGTFPDVAFFNNRIYLAVQQGSNMLNLYNFATDLTDEKVVQIPYTGDQAFPRLTVYNNILWLAFRNDSPAGVELWRSDTQNIENLGGGFGNSPVIVGNGYIAWQSGTPGSGGNILRRALTGGATVIAGTPDVATGLSRISSSGVVTTIDADRNAVSGSTNPSIATNLTVAEGPTGGVTTFFTNTTSPFVSANGQKFDLFGTDESFVPHAATNGTLYAVATWGASGVRVATIQKQ